MTTQLGQPNDDPIVTLANGHSFQTVLVAATYMRLELLRNTNPLAFYDVVMKARDPRHQIFGSAEHLGGLLDGDHMPTAVRQIIDASTQGEGLGLVLLPLSDVVQNGSTKP